MLITRQLTKPHPVQSEAGTPVRGRLIKKAEIEIDQLAAFGPGMWKTQTS